MSITAPNVVAMESLNAYLDRKYQELALLNSLLDTPAKLQRPASVEEVIERKFHLAAALKAEHISHDWASTETAWAHPGRSRAGPFEFRYDYQRADLQVRGPSFYDFHHRPVADETVYAASGMAAISALLFACARVISEADILAAPGSYSETLELIETHARHLRLVQVKQGESQASCSSERPQILLFDSCVPAIIYDSLLNSTRPHLDLVVFDTTCFAASSGRIRHVLSWADRWQIPVVLVRSHTKLDSLGVEYGRLGSAAFVTSKGGSCASEDIKNLALEMRNAIRLFGGAALPAHFPPFVGGKRYRALTNRRIAGILRNSRRAARHFALTLSGSAAELHFVHGLYLTLASDRMSSEQQARQTASEMARDLSNAGLPLRHAGSFGFDFFATEWFHHAASDRYAVRLAIADLPTQLSDELVQAIAEWWSHYERSSSARKRFDECAHTGS